MFFSNIINKVNQLSVFLQGSSIPHYLIFFVFALGAVLIGKYTPGIVQLIINKFLPSSSKEITNNFISPLTKPFQVAGTFILISLSSVWLEEYKALYNFFNPLIVLVVVISIAWLASRLFQQVLRIYGIEIIRKSGLEADELLLVFETIVNVVIGFIATIGYAQSQRFPLTGLLAGVSIGGVAISFAASKTLEQLFGTVVLYLDRPFIPGDYIRFSLGEGEMYGRVESIGLRSTKIRKAATGTLYIVPNNQLANAGIENITRGKKVMVLLYLDFTKKLIEREKALVQQVVKNSTDSVFGIDPGSTKIAVFDHEHRDKCRARITFFILGSSENSIQLRKRLLEVANQNISKELKNFGIEFYLQEPNIYVDSPMTI
ncbi:MAG: mechanosensitive ion channel [Okeania sp. SIO2G4]|uniref:mechanosensitive ion channel family protein n=1 Tax=unclassified Okeania TaxID=2634635 RepID=UPI0013B97CA6|nr:MULTISPECIES: mechanosensitive ion channel domain-containing protein [unclassified Okeania]NEP06630.1 mechanosensitive ion channel [Okeania sp. SIO4D6]NEP74014.1 mechanosensitive ion channel [Okeania sp. SIO2G5]NEP94833.1 mechanosensitive ion channel [Okeania sp. SIO2F5]NEQ93794.1 mechanosensitive ion channel [Okeania sp. SIO2G4]